MIETLRQAILHFQLQPGQRLVERELIETLGVSRTTVREALRELTSEGLVTVVPQKGAIVAAPSVEEAKDLYAARAALEAVMVQRFIANASRSQVIQLEAAVEAFAEAADANDEAGLLAAKDLFNSIIADGSRSTVLRQLTESVQARVRVLRIAAMTPGHHVEAVDELRAVVDAIRRKDTAEASARYVAHIERSAATAAKELEAKLG
ncbi:GntR family transcriptional regulator [Rhodococcus sp. NCIMB 12038]|uniref:GntR family transcriptional regulator n=1 Tax=Rhodococcus sp. NCIMB 12038 TaxID=933800 RepID=UPI00211AB9E3|nr:GntR family transcriptional regulator [Rhodococcus sp. NCIMB 12038]